MKNIKVLLVSIAAKNIHKTLAPWCLKAYCENRDQGLKIHIQENNINENTGDILSGIYTFSPDMLGFSCYIWNIELVAKVAVEIKKLLPECKIVLGGPEVSFESTFEGYPFADYIIRGAGEESFYKLLQSLKKGETPENAVLSGCGFSFTDLPSPFTNEFFVSFAAGKMASIENQLVYYESSRGCPFSCAYCLSPAAPGVQVLPLERVKEDLLKILSHGAKCVKFVDRTFNAEKKRACAILEFILSLKTACTFHFEAAADLFDEELLTVISKMPVNRVQFEIGIQSVNGKTLETVGRKADLEKAFTNIKHLMEMQNCHIHVDLLAGLPFETPETFAEGVNRCISVRPHMLQLGFLKMLKGSEIRKRAAEYDYVYTDYAPYEVMKSGSMTYSDIITLKDIEEVIDKFHNSGLFAGTVQYAIDKLFKTPFDFFSELSVYCKEKGSIKVSLKNSYTLLLNFLLQYGEKGEVEHYIKLDCLSFDAKGMLPDGIPQNRDKEAEAAYRSSSAGACKNIRAGYFSFDNKTRLFVYDRKNPVTKAYTVIEPN